MEATTADISMMELNRDLVYTFGLMVHGIRENGYKMKCRGRASSTGQIDVISRESSEVELCMAKEPILGKMVVSMMVTTI